MNKKKNLVLLEKLEKTEPHTCRVGKVFRRRKLRGKTMFLQKNRSFLSFSFSFFVSFFFVFCLFFCLRKTTLTVNRQLSERKNGSIRFCQCFGKLDCLAPSITFLSTNGRKREEILTIRQLKSSYR